VPEDVFTIDESDQAERLAARIVSLLALRVPLARVEHVGSTSVPGCIGKGDVDILVRVSPADFAGSLSTLDESLVRSGRNDVTDTYVEYDWSDAGQRAAVHLVAAGGTHDDFHRFKALLLADQELVRRYNALKLRYRGRSMDEYRRAKGEFIARALADGGAS